MAIPGTYSQALKPTPAGWPRRDQWCVWIEPIENHGPTGIWEQRWQRAVMAAVATWRQHLPIQLVPDPARAQVRVERRRPPIQQGRASHGRALLQLLEVQRDRQWRLEPRVQVLISTPEGISHRRVVLVVFVERSRISWSVIHRSARPEI